MGFRAHASSADSPLAFVRDKLPHSLQSLPFLRSHPCAHMASHSLHGLPPEHPLPPSATPPPPQLAMRDALITIIAVKSGVVRWAVCALVVGGLPLASLGARLVGSFLRQFLLPLPFARSAVGTAGLVCRRRITLMAGGAIRDLIAVGIQLQHLRT